MSEAQKKVTKKAKESFALKKNRHYHATFAGPSGEFVLQDLMKFCNMNNPSFDPLKPDPHLTAFNEGKRSAILYILSLLQVNEVQLNAMQNISNIYNTEFENSAEHDSIQESFSKGIFS